MSEKRRCLVRAMLAFIILFSLVFEPAARYLSHAPIALPIAATEHLPHSASHGHSHEYPNPEPGVFHAHGHIAGDHEHSPAFQTRRIEYAFSPLGKAAWDAVSVGVWDEPLDDHSRPPRA